MITNAVGCRPVDVLFMDSKYDDYLDEGPSQHSLGSIPFSLSDYKYGDDYEYQNWNRDPTDSELEHCRPHIHELISSYEPHGLVYLGKIAAKYDQFKPKGLPAIQILHPAFIARLEYKLLTALKEARKIDTFVESLL